MSESEPSYAKDEQKKASFPWYKASIDRYLIPQTQQLLEQYSGIPRDQQSKHVHDIREKSWAIRAYPCVGLGVWLNPYLPHSPAYSDVLTRLKSGETIMDIGCLIGGDLRQLAFDGAPTDKMYAIDIVSQWEIGYECYRDKDRFKARFISADILSQDQPELVALHGKVDIISISAVMHQWSWAKQIEGGKRLVQFSSGKGSVVLGHQIGNTVGDEKEFQGMNTFRHTPETWTRLWEQVGKETGTKWETKARSLTFGEMGWDLKDMAWMPEETRVLTFVVTRVE